MLSFPGGSDDKIVCLQCGRPGFDPWVGKSPWGRKRQPTPVPLPGESHGWRNLRGYSPWGHKELDTTSLSLSMYLNTFCKVKAQAVSLVSFGKGSARSSGRSSDLGVKTSAFQGRLC